MLLRENPFSTEAAAWARPPSAPRAEVPCSASPGRWLSRVSPSPQAHSVAESPHSARPLRPHPHEPDTGNPTPEDQEALPHSRTQVGSSALHMYSRGPACVLWSSRWSPPPRSPSSLASGPSLGCLLPGVPLSRALTPPLCQGASSSDP